MLENIDIKENWYAIYTMPRAEKKVYERLVDIGVTSYLPLVTTIRIWSDRKKKVTSPLISSFVFVKIEESKLISLYQIQGVTGVLKYLKKPAVIKDTEIENLKILLSDSDNFSILDNPVFEKGETVRVLKGPFQGLIAQFYQNKGKHRVIVTIDSITTGFEVNVPSSFLEKFNN
jgi:transcriptional antiterminator RfaH